MRQYYSDTVFPLCIRLLMNVHVECVFHLHRRTLWSRSLGHQCSVLLSPLLKAVSPRMSCKGQFLHHFLLLPVPKPARRPLALPHSLNSSPAPEIEGRRSILLGCGPFCTKTQLSAKKKKKKTLFGLSPLTFIQLRTFTAQTRTNQCSWQNLINCS